MKGVELYGRVRHAVRIEGLSRREAARRFGIDPRTVAKMMVFSVPPGYRRSRPPARPKLDPFIGIIDQILEEDKGRPAKQRHTSKRIFERLRDEHGLRRRPDDREGLRVASAGCGSGRCSCRCGHEPGHAQADFGEALAEIGGVEQKIHFFAFDLPHSDASFVQAYPAETTEAFCDGHTAAFDFFGGVPNSILYDNTRIAVARILGDGNAAADAGVQRVAVALPVRGSVRPPRQGQRQGQGRGTGRLDPAELPGADAADGEYRGAEREADLTTAVAGSAIGCAVTARRSASGWRATLPPSSPCRRRPTTPARRSRAGSARCRWCAIAAPTTRCRPPTATARS